MAYKIRLLATEINVCGRLDINVNVHVYSSDLSPDICVSSADCTTYTPGTGTHSLQSHLLRGEFSI